MAAQTASLDGATEVRDVHLKVDTRFANVKVVGEAGQEARDKNMPRNLHNAAELFLRCGLVDNAEKLTETTAAMFKILASDPTARRTRWGGVRSAGRAATAAWQKTRKRRHRPAAPAAATTRTGSASSPTRSRRSRGSRPRP